MQQTSNDTSRFQTLDFVLVPRPWFPAVHQAKAILSPYVPTDHFLVEAHFSIKLGSKLHRTRPPVKLDFTMTELSEEQKLQVIYKYNHYISTGSFPSDDTASDHTARDHTAKLNAYTDGAGPIRGLQSWIRLVLYPRQGGWE